MSNIAAEDRWRQRYLANGAQVLKSDPYSDPDEESDMEFRLTYEGVLLGASRSNTRADHKHEIRRVFHKQLRTLWAVTPHLQKFYIQGLPAPQVFDRKEYFAQQYQRCGFRFVPLIANDMSMLCSVQILFLRADAPGSLVKGGDIDNRIKTLFDALRMPANMDELGGHQRQPDEDPFFVLLEDDYLITHLALETDRLLQPIGTNSQLDANDARVILTIKTRASMVTTDNIAFI